MSLSKHEDTAVQMERVSSSDLEAEKAHATEHAERLSELADPDAGKSPEERAAIDRKLMRKVDLWLIPWLCLLYLLSFLDRSNIGNARLAGMEEDLDMGGHDYNNALTIFFISYALAEPITNIYPTIPNTLSWASNNIEGIYKRGVIIGIVVGWGNLNGVVSSNIYIKEEKPKYYTGHGTVLAYLVVCLLGGTIFMYTMLRAENKRRLSGKRDNMHAGKSADDIW
ncbi:hypothetical protein KC352_g40843, partial [Hortaea werneckii]